MALLAGVVAAAAALSFTGCGGSAVRRQARALAQECRPAGDEPVDERQARCIARFYGMRDTPRCPLAVEALERSGAPVFVVRETCSDLAVVIDRASARLRAVLAADVVILD